MGHDVCSTRCSTSSGTELGSVRVGMFHHLAQLPSLFCQNPICLGRIGADGGTAKIIVNPTDGTPCTRSPLSPPSLSCSPADQCRTAGMRIEWAGHAGRFFSHCHACGCPGILADEIHLSPSFNGEFPPLMRSPEIVRS